MMKKVLHRMRKCGVDINAVARDLDIGRGTLDAILEMAVREGHVEKASAASGCGGCPLSSRCGVKPSQYDEMKMYVLTPRGKKYAGS